MLCGSLEKHEMKAASKLPKVLKRIVINWILSTLFCVILISIGLKFSMKIVLSFCFNAFYHLFRFRGTDKEEKEKSEKAI